jgi:hypothetical protein
MQGFMPVDRDTPAALAVAVKAEALLQDCRPSSCRCKVLPAEVAHSQLLACTSRTADDAGTHTDDCSE